MSVAQSVAITCSGSKSVTVLPLCLCLCGFNMWNNSFFGLLTHLGSLWYQIWIGNGEKATDIFLFVIPSLQLLFLSGFLVFGVLHAWPGTSPSDLGLHLQDWEMCVGITQSRILLCAEAQFLSLQPLLPSGWGLKARYSSIRATSLLALGWDVAAGSVAAASVVLPSKLEEAYEAEALCEPPALWI